MTRCYNPLVALNTQQEINLRFAAQAAISAEVATGCPASLSVVLWADKTNWGSNCFRGTALPVLRGRAVAITKKPIFSYPWRKYQANEDLVSLITSVAPMFHSDPAVLVEMLSAPQLKAALIGLWGFPGYIPSALNGRVMHGRYQGQPVSSLTRKCDVCEESLVRHNGETWSKYIWRTDNSKICYKCRSITTPP